MSVEVTVFNKQRRVSLRLPWLRRFAGDALTVCLGESGDSQFALRVIPVVEVTVVSDATIARVHRDFMSIEGPTDVITFEHGEIVVSADTACVCAKERGHSVEEELGLYVIHGLLHLNGFDDLEPVARRRMHGVQDRIWCALRKLHPVG